VNREYSQKRRRDKIISKTTTTNKIESSIYIITVRSISATTYWALFLFYRSMQQIQWASGKVKMLQFILSHLLQQKLKHKRYRILVFFIDTTPVIGSFRAFFER